MDGEMVGEGGTEMGGERDYIPTCRYTVTTRMTPGLRSAMVRAVLIIVH